MAKIGLVRIDSRLIHGQVCTQWLYRTKSKKVYIIDDQSAKDPFLSQLFSMACPVGVELETISCEEAGRRWQANQLGEVEPIFILFKDVPNAYRAYMAGFNYPELQVGGIVRFTGFILKGIVIIELLGAAIMAPVFIGDYGFGEGLWMAVFHSISAFCNAGFDLMGHAEQYSSLCGYTGDWVVIGTISALIIIGGIGFIVWDDLYRKKWDFRHYMLHTKIVLVTTATLLAVSTVLFYLMERDNILVGMSGSEKFWACFFSAVTPRTAGFNNVDTAALTDGSKFMTAILMFIGGSPGSTAGGIKTSTLAVLLLYVHSNIRQTYGVEIFGRRLQDESIRQSACILTINLSLMLTATILIMVFQNLPMSDVFFETCSAIGTSGMSTGVTRSLNTFSRIVIILLMYCGRIGSLSFALAFTRSSRKPHVQLPAERITIG